MTGAARTPAVQNTATAPVDAADFTVGPPALHNLKLVTNQTRFMGDHSVMAKGEKVVVAFSLSVSPGMSKKASVAISGLVARQGNAAGEAPISLYSNGQIFVQDFTLPGGGLTSNETSFQIPSGLLTNGKNEISLEVSAKAQTKFWLYRLVVVPDITSSICSGTFAKGVENPSSTSALLWFQPCSWEAGYAILHYQVDNGVQQNVNMTYNDKTSRWEYTISSINQGQAFTYSYTYQKSGEQHDTELYTLHP